MENLLFYGFLSSLAVAMVLLVVRTNRLLNIEAKLILLEQNKPLKKVPQELQFELSIRSGVSVNVRPHTHGRMDLVRWAQDISSAEVKDHSIQFPALTHA